MVNQLYCRHCGKELTSEYDNFGFTLCCKCSIIRLGDTFYADGSGWMVVYKNLFASGCRSWLTLYKIRKLGRSITIINFFKDSSGRLAVKSMNTLSEEELVMVSEIMQRLNNEIKKVK